LISAEHLQYVGGFALPQGDVGTSWFGFGGIAMTPHRDKATGKLTLFITGTMLKDAQIAQIEVPSTLVKSNNYDALPVATVLQPFADVTDGEISLRPNSLGNATNGSPTYGLLSFNNRLIVANTNYYDYDQIGSHGVSSLDLSLKGDWSGFQRFSNALAKPRALGGAMGVVPNEWQSMLGGPALTGNQTVPISSATSFGPALTAFNPDDVGTNQQIPGNTLLFYPIDKPLCGTYGCENTANPIFNLTTIIRGHALPSRTGSILFIAKHGIGEYWYGGMTSQNGTQAAPGSMGVGPKSDRYEFRIYAYKLNDLADVKSGLKSPSQVMPYAIWPLPELTSMHPEAFVNGSTYDDQSGLLFVTPQYSNKGIVQVYKINKPIQ
jgi:hypothetical protein